MQPSWKWSTLPAQVMVAIVLGVMVLLVVIPQAIAVIVTAALTSTDVQVGLVDTVKLWWQADPTVITGVPVAAWQHWVIVALVLAFVACIAILLVVVTTRRRRDPQQIKGLSPISPVVAELGTGQLVKRGPQLRPLLQHHRQQYAPTDVGYRIGSFVGVDVWLRIEDPTIVIGPSRAGKGWYLVLGWILDAPGAVITTSSKMDNAQLTMRQRERQGSRVWIFAPGIAGGDALGHVLRWNPIEGCVDELTLVRRIHALIPQGVFSGSTSNGGHWDTLGQQLAAHLFHAAACLGANVDKVWEWVGNPTRALEAVDAIRNHPQGLYEHATHLETVINMPAEQRAVQWGVLPSVLAFLGSGIARDWMKPHPGEEIDLVDFVLNRGTLYLVGDKQTTGGYKRIIDGLLAEIDYVTKGLADASPGARVDPPVSYILDEAGNFEYQGLYELITAGGGRGRVVIAVFQSRDQLKQFGDEETLWDAAVAKIILPGGANAKELKDISDLIGEQWVARESHSWGSGAGSVQVSEERRAIIEASAIREMKAGYALLFYRNLKPVVPKLTPFSKHAHYPACKHDAVQVWSQVQAASPFAAQLEQHRQLGLEEAETRYA